jgi:hypothetical protein
VVGTPSWVRVHALVAELRILDTVANHYINTERFPSE